MLLELLIGYTLGRWSSGSSTQEFDPLVNRHRYPPTYSPRDSYCSCEDEECKHEQEARLAWSAYWEEKGLLTGV